MKGLVNYYIDEDEENYRVIRGNVDIYKFTLAKTQIELIDPVEQKQNLDFLEKGVTFVNHETNVKFGDVLTTEQKQEYENELDDLLKSQLKNVEDILVFDHNIRSEWAEASRNSPAYHVHSDFHYDAAVNRVKILLGEERAKSWLGEDGHVAIVNVWRPTVRSVEKSPLAFLDIDSVEDKDIVQVRLEYGTRVGIMQGFKSNQKHKWYWINQMRPDQAWIFCQFDSRSRVSVPHSAVEIFNTPSDAISRTSIESRCLIKFSD